jgi:uncharacterized repeat protein (TIGR03803 family)
LRRKTLPKLCPVSAGVALGISACIPAQAAPYEILYSFKGGSTDGSNVPAGLLKVGSLLYGMNYGGGANGLGTVFSITPDGAEKVVYSFKGGTDGANPWADLINVHGTLYGTTDGGGPVGAGTIFNITTAGVEKVLYAFTGNYINNDGIGPMAALVRVGDTLYGTTSGGDPMDTGTIFKITLAGDYTEMYYFLGGVEPSGPTASLMAYNNRLYGTTFQGGFSRAYGAAFEITKGGYLQTIYNFGAGTDGADPNAALINVNGLFYGTTESGGTSEFGTVFSLTPGGVETVLHNFSGTGPDGGGPDGTLLNVDGTLYGTTGAGYNRNGAFNGSLFSITPSGVLTVLHSFHKATDGIAPLGNLIKVGNALYGTTWSGGAAGLGTVFKYKLK